MSALKFSVTSSKPSYKSPLSVFRSIRSLLTWHAIRTHALDQIGWNQSRSSRSAVLHGVPIPWFTYASIEFIDQTTPDFAHILEIGGGNSSLFWMNRGNKLLTLETNEEWVNRIRSSSSFNDELHEVIAIPHETQAIIDEVLGYRKFDVVINDGLGERADLGSYLSTRVNENGMLIWDNSDRESDASAIEILKLDGWKSLECFGLGPINAYCTKTTILHRGLVL